MVVTISDKRRSIVSTASQTQSTPRGEAGASGILVNHTGGNRAVAANGVAIPGDGAANNGAQQLGRRPSNPLTHGSYAFWTPGQYQQFVGVEGEAGERAEISSKK